MQTLGLSAGSFVETMSDGWRFHRGEAPVEVAEALFDDSGWDEVRVPHDWAIAGPFDPAADGGTGKLPWQGEGWYRRTFDLPDGHGDRRVTLDFDGIMAFPVIYINGREAGSWDYGYTGFRIDATPHVEWGKPNTIAVHVDTRRWGSRWYPGAGIYRKVILTVSEPVHIARHGVQIRTNGDELAGIPPNVVTVATRVANHLEEQAMIRVQVRLLDPEGSEVAASEESVTVFPERERTVSQVLEVAGVRRWDVDDPVLYTAQVTLSQGGKPTDQTDVQFGFRTFAFTADDGFHLNGSRVQLYGVNLHHDLGPLGAAFNRRAAERQLEIMQSMGVNALRTSHNPPAPEVLDLCDRMGILVWDEVFDKYDATAGRPDLQPPLPEFGRRHIREMVLRDFNHPSIVVWSTGNELTGEDAVEGINPARVQMMADFVREIDDSRPVAQGCHIQGLVDGKNFAGLDLGGWNYDRRYMNYRRQWPHRPIIYSESASTVSTRGYYEPDLPLRRIDRSPTLQVSSYDLNSADWADVPDREFALMEQDRFVAGEFVWTGFDYLGEPTPFGDDARSSYFGIVDLCGHPKDRFYLYRSHWRPEETTVHILPHWNWPGRVGRNVPVFVYTNGDSAELFLNGKSLGLRRKAERPKHPQNLALDGRASASSESEGRPAAAAVDGNLNSLWSAAANDRSASFRLDLGGIVGIQRLVIDTDAKENAYAYTVEASADGLNWKPIVAKPTRPYPKWNGPTRAFHDVDTESRYLRLTFSESTQGHHPGLREFAVYDRKSDNDYYDVTYDYRLRWNEVAYAPGQLKAIAYRDGRAIGEAMVETAGEPVALRLTTDRSRLSADGEDLAFVTVEAVDAKGRRCPLADNQVTFEVSGAGRLNATGNGNPLSMESFAEATQRLFFGLARGIVRADEGDGGIITVRVNSAGLVGGSLELTSAR
ncbi:MAG: glycoside hydrolase family 2 TIM barrel-domain containing protein [Opitutaceae bacterium]